MSKKLSSKKQKNKQTKFKGPRLKTEPRSFKGDESFLILMLFELKVPEYTLYFNK